MRARWVTNNRNWAAVFQALIETRVTINRVAITHVKNQRDPASLDAMNTLLTNTGASLSKRKNISSNYVNSEAISREKDPALDAEAEASKQM